MSFVPGWLFYFVSHYIMTGSFHISLFEGTPYVDKIHVRFKIANITHAPPVLVYQQTDFMLKHVVILHQLRDFVPEWLSRPSTMTGVNSHWGDSCRHVIFCWLTEISVSPGDRRKSPSSRPWRAGYSDPNKKIFILEDGKIHCVNFSLQARW